MYEEIHVRAAGSPKLLSQTYLGDVADPDRLFDILRDVPVEQWDGWNCVAWVETALKMISGEDEDMLEVGPLAGMRQLKREALEAADAEVARKEALTKAML